MSFRGIGTKGLDEVLIVADSLRYIPFDLGDCLRRQTVKEMVLYTVLVGVRKGWLYGGGGELWETATSAQSW